MTITVQHVIDRLRAHSGMDAESPTVDTLKSGRPDAAVRRIAVVFTATYSAIRRAVDSGADLIVTHEPTYYNHMDEGDWLAGDPVYEKKRALIESSGIAIFRLHDHIHQYAPDGILAGMLGRLEWERYAEPGLGHLLTVPDAEKLTVRDIAEHLKRRLSLNGLLLVGDPDQPVRRFAFMPGAPGGRRQIRCLGESGVDLLIAGETSEWETNEYARDAADMGLGKALLITGHQRSEEAGMETAAALLREAFPDVEVELIAGPPAMRFV